MQFECDPKKAMPDLQRHGVSFGEALLLTAQCGRKGGERENKMLKRSKYV
jgi:uncharacterized DUF497 family protein